MGHQTLTFDEIRFDDTFLLSIQNSVQLVNDMPSPRCIKSHLPLQLLPEQFDIVKPKVYKIFQSIMESFNNIIVDDIYSTQSEGLVRIPL